MIRHENRLPIRIWAARPDPKETPWWARAAMMTHTHMVVVSPDGFVISQPWRGECRQYRLHEYEKYLDSRSFTEVVIEVDFFPAAWMYGLSLLHNVRSQRIRTLLRYFGLWWGEAWNCTGPVRVLLASQGIEIKGETPDEIIRELAVSYGSHQ